MRTGMFGIFVHCINRACGVVLGIENRHDVYFVFSSEFTQIFWVAVPPETASIFKYVLCLLMK